jgi:hypothetical protein
MAAIGGQRPDPAKDNPVVARVIDAHQLAVDPRGHARQNRMAGRRGRPVQAGELVAAGNGKPADQTGLPVTKDVDAERPGLADPGPA